MKESAEYFAGLMTGAGTEESKAVGVVMNNFVATCAITSLNLQLLKNPDAVAIKEAIITAWRLNEENKLSAELQNHKSMMESDAGKLFGGVFGDTSDLENKCRSAIDEVEKIARVCIIVEEQL